MNEELLQYLSTMNVGDFLPVEIEAQYPFVTPRDTFEIKVFKGYKDNFVDFETRWFNNVSLETRDGAAKAWKRIS